MDLDYIGRLYGVSNLMQNSNSMQSVANSHDQPWTMSCVHDDIAWVVDLLTPGLLEHVNCTDSKQQFGEFMQRHWVHAHRRVLFPRGGFICGGIAYYIAL